MRRRLLRMAFNEFFKSDFGTHERRNALASLENIEMNLHQGLLALDYISD